MASYFRLNVLLPALVLASGIALNTGSTSAQEPAKTLNDGVYTDAQAERGKKAFEFSCTACHDTDRFKAEFFEGWKNEPLFGLFEMISGTMPADNPGGLKPQDYSDIIAYFLKVNGYATGATELGSTKEAIGDTRIEAVKAH